MNSQFMRIFATQFKLRELAHAVPLVYDSIDPHSSVLNRGAGVKINSLAPIYHYLSEMFKILLINKENKIVKFVGLFSAGHPAGRLGLGYGGYYARYTPEKSPHAAIKRIEQK